MKNRTLILSGIGLGLAVSASVQAEQEQLDTLVVTAGLLPIESEKLGRAHTVLTGADLEKNQYRYVADALRTVPGLAVSRTGSFGGLTQVRVRGSEANHVLVLIDGIEASATSQGEFDFGGLQVANIERIEVLRGPQSAFYGSNATSGVIHIITKGGMRNAQKFTTEAELGTDNTVNTRLAYQGGGDDYDISMSGAFRHTDGVNVALNGDEKDGAQSHAWDTKLNWDVTDSSTVNMTLRYVDRETDFDNQSNGVVSDAPNKSNNEEFTLGLGLRQSFLNDKFVQTTRFELTDIESRTVSNSRYGNDNRRVHISTQGSYFFSTPNLFNAKHSITGAIEGKRETFLNRYPTHASQVPKHKRDLIGYVLEYKGEFSDRLFVNSALRRDDNEMFDNVTTYSASVAYLLPDTGTRLHSSFGKGVTNPSFSEQFGYVPELFTGNPDLKPEHNNGWDFGVEQAFWDERLIVDVTYFDELLKNEIATANGSPFNFNGKSKRKGVELSAQMDVTDSVFIKGSYTYLYAKEPNGREEVRRPMHTGAVNVTYTLPNERGNLFADVVYNGSMQDGVWINGATQRVDLDSYVIVTAGADYQLNDTFQIYGRIENLFDEDYQEVYGFNTPGIEGFVGLRATF